MSCRSVGRRGVSDDQPWPDNEPWATPSELICYSSTTYSLASMWGACYWQSISPAAGALFVVQRDSFRVLRTIICRSRSLSPVPSLVCCQKHTFNLGFTRFVRIQWLSTFFLFSFRRPLLIINNIATLMKKKSCSVRFFIIYFATDAFVCSARTSVTSRCISNLSVTKRCYSFRMMSQEMLNTPMKLFTDDGKDFGELPTSAEWVYVSAPITPKIPARGL